MTSGKASQSDRDRFLCELEPVLDGLYRMARRLAGDVATAEDVFQDSLLKAYRFFNTFQPGTNFRAWMHRVLYSVFVNRTRERTPRAPSLEGLGELGEPPRSLLDELEHPTHAERSSAVLEAVDDQIKQAVEDLPRDLRLVFLLNTVEGLKYREIAEVMDCPLGTVMSRLFRGRRLLQEKLAAYARESGFLREGDFSGE